MRSSPILTDVARRLILVFLIGTSVALPTGCTLGQPSSKPAIGDTCLVGRWILENEENRSGYAYAGTPVPVTGLHGAKLTLSADGTETEVFDGSDPLVGTLADGKVLSISIGGSLAFHLKADGRQYVETGARTTLPTTSTLGGVTIANYQSFYAPGRGTYECSQQTFTTTTSSGVQTDNWSRA